MSGMWLVFIIIGLSQAGARYENVNIKQDWWETAVFYQLNTRSFMDSDGDGIGDINGITSRLEYLKELGVDAAWLSPIFKSPMIDFGYDTSDYYTVHPEYGTMEDFEHLLKKANELNIKIVLELVPNHTSNESEWFLKSANRDEYYSDWYVWESGHIDNMGGRKPPNNWISAFKKSAWTYMPNRDQYYLHQFGDSQPDLNFRNPVVVDEIKNIIKFWLERGIAGLRIPSINYLFEVDKDLFGGRYPNEPITGRPDARPDDYNYLEHVYTKDQEETYDMVSQFRDVFDSITIRDNLTRWAEELTTPKTTRRVTAAEANLRLTSLMLGVIVLTTVVRIVVRIMMTEADTTIKNAEKYYGEGSRLGAHIPFNLALIEELNKESDARDFKYVTDRWLTYKPLKRPANWIVGNHDRSRVSSRFRSDLVDAFNMLILLLPGIAISYMGEEIGMTNGFVPWSETKDPLACNTDDPVNYIEVSRDPARTPFQWNAGKNAGFSTAERTWLPVAEGFESLNVANQRSAVRSHYQVYRTLTNLRIRPAFRLGRYESLALNKDVFAFKRWYNDDTYIIVMNVGTRERVVNLTAFDLVFGQLEVEASSVLSSRTYSDNVEANRLFLSMDEALVLRMQV